MFHFYNHDYKNLTFRQVSTLYIIHISVYSSREDVINESMFHNNTVQTNAKEFTYDY